MGVDKFMDDNQPYGLTAEIRCAIATEAVAIANEKLKQVLSEEQFEKFNIERAAKLTLFALKSGNDRTITAAKAAPNVPTMPPVYAVSADDVIENMEAELELCNKALADLNIVGTAHMIYDRVAEMLREQIDFVKGLPQVEPEPRKGKWLINSDGYYPYCSECNAEPKSGEMTNFCPKCGAKMEGEGWHVKNLHPITELLRSEPSRSLKNCDTSSIRKYMRQ